MVVTLGDVCTAVRTDTTRKATRAMHAMYAGAGVSTHMKWLDLRGLFLEGISWPWADLSEVLLDGAVFRAACLCHANLRAASLQAADLRGADLHDADLSNADLRGADLSNADLSGAQLSATR